MNNFNKGVLVGSDEQSWTKAPGLFAILMAVNVASYTLCAPMMIKILEGGQTSICSLIGMMILAVVGTRLGDRLYRSGKKFPGIFLGITLAIGGIVVCALDIFDILYIPGPTILATATGDMVFFTATYIISDVFSEVFGYKASRLSGNTAAIFAVTAALIGKLMTGIPVPEYAAANESAFDFVYNCGIYATVVGVIIYAIGDWFNDGVFSWIKSRNSKTDYASYSLRAIGSSLIGKTMDLTLFSILVMVPFSTPAICEFLGMDSWGMTFESLLGNYLLGIALQITVEATLSPISYLISNKIRYKMEETPAVSLNG